ncbi:hypothetical protein [Companilactobacillus sp. HBUAS59699]
MYVSFWELFWWFYFYTIPVVGVTYLFTKYHNWKGIEKELTDFDK